MTESFCGIDYSMKALDLAVVRGPTLISAKQYALGVDLASRIAVIQRALDELIATPYAPSVICLEQPWVREGRGIKSALDLHRIPHYVEALAAERGITDVRYVAIATWRAELLGNGRLQTEAAKAASMQHVRRVFDGYEADSDNQSDAICLALWCQANARYRERVGA